VLTVNLRAIFFVLQAVARTMKAQSPLAGSELRGKLSRRLDRRLPRRQP
jgi:hypothetical protein